MYFYFENGRKETEALITGFSYDPKREMYVLAVLGIGSDGISFSEPGKVWLADQELQTIMDYESLEFPHNLIGRRMMLSEQEKGGEGHEKVEKEAQV